MEIEKSLTNKLKLIYPELNISPNIKLGVVFFSTTLYSKILIWYLISLKNIEPHLMVSHYLQVFLLLLVLSTNLILERHLPLKNRLKIAKNNSSARKKNLQLFFVLPGFSSERLYLFCDNLRKARSQKKKLVLKFNLALHGCAGMGLIFPQLFNTSEISLLVLLGIFITLVSLSNFLSLKVLRNNYEEYFLDKCLFLSELSLKDLNEREIFKL